MGGACDAVPRRDFWVILVRSVEQRGRAMAEVLVGAIVCCSSCFWTASNENVRKPSVQIARVEHLAPLIMPLMQAPSSSFVSVFGVLVAMLENKL